MSAKKFAIIGATGYIAPKHIEAINKVGGEIVAEQDINGDMKTFVSKCRNEKPDYFVVCSPNYLHKHHSAVGLALEADVICEKPVSLNSRDLHELQKLEIITGKKIYSIMQLRYLFEGISKNGTYKTIKIEYHLPRNESYFQTWKGQPEKSGGIITNIGIHIFDLCLQFCGEPIVNPIIFYKDDKEIVGKLYLENGEVDFSLSVKPGEQKRIFILNDTEIDFTNYRDDLHILSYTEILNGNGFRLEDAKPAIKLCEQLNEEQL